MEWVCRDPHARVRAANVKATLEAFSFVPSTGRRLIERHRLPIDDLKPDNFIPVQRWLDALKEIQEEVGPNVVRKVGANIIRAAEFPPSFATADDIFAAMDSIYYINHQGDVGHYHTTRMSDGTWIVRCETPYPRNFEWGLVEGIASRNEAVAGAPRYRIEYVEAPDGGDLTCTVYARPRAR